MPDCLLCGKITRLLFSTRDYARPEDRTVYTVNWCADCSFGRIEGDFTPEIVNLFYPTTYYTHSARVGPSPNHTFLERLRVHLAWRTDNGTALQPSELAPASSICDIGCGNGDNLRKFKLDGTSIAVGIDPDRLARDMASDAGEIFDGTAKSLPKELAGKQFEIVLLSHVLEHCIDPARAILNAKSLLSKNGTLVVEVPNNEAVAFKLFGALWPWSDVPRHLSFFTEPSLSKLLERSGLRILKVHYVGYTRQFMPAWISSQQGIWGATCQGRPPNFGTAAWWLLLKTFWLSPRRRYNSIRVHAALS